MIKFLTACGTGINSSLQIKNAIEEEMKKRGYQVSGEAVRVNDVTEELLSKYDVFCPISAVDFSFTPKIPIVIAGAILYRMPAMANPVFDEFENIIKNL